MKRYIKTNKTIFDTHDIPDYWRSIEPRFVVLDDMLIVYDRSNPKLITNHGKVVDESDTLEDLIDYYIVDYFQKEDGMTFRYCANCQELFFGENGDWRRNVGIPEGQIIVYGAIWSVLGNDAIRLEPVAKMNRYCKLELEWCVIKDDD